MGAMMEQTSTNRPVQRLEDEAPVAEGGLIQRQGARMQARLRPLVQGALVIVDKVRLQAIVSTVAGLWVWGVLFYPFDAFGRIWIIALGIGALGALLFPAGILFLFWAGLRELISVPDRLLEMAGQGEVRTGELMGTMSSAAEPRRMRRIWRFFRTVLDLRNLILESKGLLLQFALVARVANPVFIIALFVAFVASLLLILVAVVMLLVVLF